MVKSTSRQPLLLHLARVQLAAAVIVSLAIAVLRDWSLQTFASALCGGLVIVLSWGYFGWRSFRHTDLLVGEQLGPHQVLGEFFRAGLGKFLFVAVTLGLLFRFGQGFDKLALLIGFVATLLFGVFGSLLLIAAGDDDDKNDEDKGEQQR